MFFILHLIDQELSEKTSVAFPRDNNIVFLVLFITFIRRLKDELNDDGVLILKSAEL